MIKVLQLTKHYPPYKGGIESVTYDLTEGLIDERVKVDVLCCNDKNRTVVDDEFGYKVIRAASLGKLFSTSISPALIWELKKLINNYHIIHVHFPDPMSALALFLTRPRCKIIVHWHSDIVKQKNILKLFLPLQEWILERADKIIGTSPIYIAESLQLRKVIQKCVSIPIGIKKDRVKLDRTIISAVKKEFLGKRIIFSFGRHVYYKGFQHLIDSAEYLPSDTVILIGGDGPLRKTYQSQIDEKNLGSRVKLLGRLSDMQVYSILKASNIFCFPSTEKSEAFGVVQVEAMCLGIPIVATNIPGSGVPWVNQHNVTGLNVEPSNSRELGKAMSQILSDPPLTKLFSKNGRRRYLDVFMASNMVNSVKNLYDGFLL